ncbi:MAG: LptF/LptG family permease [Cytophagales bacterium]
MFKKIDYLILRAYIGPFILSFAVVTFILLLHFMLGYISDLIGKDLDFWVYAKLIGYFSFNVMQMAFPLSVLVSSLIAFGNLGEHFELTALKATGVSLLRALRPIFVFVMLITLLAFYISNTIVPYANLKAYSLLWDARMKKPSVSFTEGMFYYGLEGYAIKVGKKVGEKNIENIIINNFSQGRGNTEVVLAEKGTIENLYNGTYLKLDLFNGNSYSEVFNEEDGNAKKEFVRTKFDTSSIMFSLESFKMQRTDENLFKSNEVMMNVSELNKGIDSINKEIKTRNTQMIAGINTMYNLQNKKNNDSLAKQVKGFDIKDSNKDLMYRSNVYNSALNNIRNIKNIIQSSLENVQYNEERRLDFEIEKFNKWTHAAACIIMFLIGAPLGAIIKKGGLGMPLLVSVIFFVIFYICTLFGKRLVTDGLANIYIGMWLADIVLMPFGLMFLFQAKNDSRMFEINPVQIVKEKLLKKK